MSGLLGRIRVRTKMLLMVSVTVISMIAVQGLSLYELWRDLNKERQLALTELTDVAYSLIDRQVKLIAAGERTLAEGQAEAMADIRSLRYAGNEYFFILDERHNMLMHPISAKIDGTNVVALRDASGDLFMQALVEVAQQPDGGFVEYYWNRPGSTEPVPKLSYARGNNSWGWIVATGVYTDDILDAFWDEFLIAMEFLIGVLLVAMLLAYRITHAMIRPVEALQDTMTRVAGTRDLTLRAQTNNTDEFGTMAESFNGMMANFHDLIQEMAKATNQVSSAATELSATTEQTSNGMKQQQDETAAVATAINEMNATVHEVSRNTVEASEASRNASEASEAGQRIVLSSIDAVRALAVHLDESSEITARLETDAANIANILEVINEIAEQTNLLALNAAIEAARAGEQGRGFAVVADEVRSLSARTAESTREIAAVIESLQAGVKSAAGTMATSSQEADDVVRQAETAGDALNQISAAIQQIDAMSVQIATATEQQSAVAEEINQNIVRINNVTEESAVGSNQIAQASEELAELSDRLKNAADRFKVGF